MTETCPAWNSAYASIYNSFCFVTDDLFVPIVSGAVAARRCVGGRAFCRPAPVDTDGRYGGVDLNHGSPGYEPGTLDLTKPPPSGSYLSSKLNGMSSCSCRNWNHANDRRIPFRRTALLKLSSAHSLNLRRYRHVQYRFRNHSFTSLTIPTGIILWCCLSTRDG